GENVYDHFALGGWFSNRKSYGHNMAQINHYMVRSSEAFLMKRLRGTANTMDQDRINFDYFKQYDRNPKSNTSIQKHIPAIRKQIEAWCRDIPGLRDMHNASVSYHKARIAMIRTELITSDADMSKTLGLIDEMEQDIPAIGAG
ncbi:MAG: hypothetical protein ACPGRD_09005, partial [Planktomarina sp.]